MPEESPASDDGLLLQAKRLRFTDAALEQRFRAERLEAGRNRARGLAVVATLIAAINGWNDMRQMVGTVPDFVAADLSLRFLVMAPAFFGIFAATLLPGHSRRADWVNVACMTIACWGNGLIYWHYAQFFPQSSYAGQLLGSVVPVLVLGVFALPLSFRAILVMVALVAGGTLTWFAATLGLAHARGLTVLTSGLVGLGGAATLLGWWRERGERTMFAQREQVRRLADQLAASNAQLARVNADQAEFMTIAAHDLRAPLATVRGYAQLLRGGRLKDAEAQARALGEIEAQAARMFSLVDDYLGIHAAAGQSRAAIGAPVDLVACAHAAVARHEAVALAKRQVLSAGQNSKGPIWARGDETLLAQVADNLVTNALKFSPPGSPVRVVVLSAAPGRVRLAVIDEGPGIAKEEQGALFQKFGRASTRPTGGEKSHGLGLAVVRRLADAMGAAVGCDSVLGGGATFWIELPACRPDEIVTSPQLPLPS